MDLKRENANIDADTAMGTMLKYGSEGSKYFVNNYVLPKEIAAAHITRTFISTIRILHADGNLYRFKIQCSRKFTTIRF